MKFKLFVEWKNAEYVFDSEQEHTVGDLFPLLKDGSTETALSAARESFYCRFEKNGVADISLLVKDADRLDIEAEQYTVIDLRLNQDDNIVASLDATFTVELVDDWNSGAHVTEWIKAQTDVYDCVVPNLLIDGAHYSTLQAPAYTEEIRITAVPATM